jgi:small-conductance mechanosensitive channel
MADTGSAVIPHQELLVTGIWVAVGLVAVSLFAGSVNAETLQMRKEKADALRKWITIALSLGVLLWALGRFGLDLSAYLVGFGISAIVIALAAQSTIANFIAGILVFTEKTISPGDFVKLNVGGLIEGRIQEISFLRTRLITNDGIMVSIPNSVLLNTAVSNYTLSGERPLIVLMNISDVHRDVARLRSQLMDGMKKEIGAEKVSRVHVRNLQKDSVDFEVWVTVTTGKFLSERDRAVEDITRTCARLGLTINSLSTT